MLLRSTSSPVLRAFVSQIVTSQSASLCLQRTSSEGDIKGLTSTKETTLSTRSFMSPLRVKAKEKMNFCIETVCCLLKDNKLVEEEKSICLADGLAGGGVGGGGICGVGSGGDGSWDSGHGPNGSDHESMDVYYQNMIRAYPGDALLLANYSKFLKEVRGDAVKAEEVCERAILAANGSDGNVLSMYGDLIWNNHEDRNRAQAYFDRAVQSSPDDCYVLASYAHFLWDDEEEDDDQEDKPNFQLGGSCEQEDNLPQGFSPMAAAAS